MANADRVQIILEARNELSQEIRKAEKDLKSLKAREAAMVKDVVAGNVLVKNSYDEVHDEVVQLEAAISRLREKRKMLSAQERAEARKAVQDELEIQEGIKRREAAIVSLTRRIEGVTNVLVQQRRGWDLLSARIGRAAAEFKAKWSSAINSISRKMESLHRKTSSMFSGTLTRYAGFAAGLLTSMVGMMGLKTASMLEQTGIAFETMLGSVKEAKKMSEWLKKTTMETPFELQGLTTATQRLLAFGFSAKEARKNLITIGDAAAATGLQQEGIERVSLAIGQMQGKQKIQSQEMRQLTEAGIPAWEMLAEKMGMTVAELMAMSESKGGGAEIFNLGGLDMLLQSMNDRYGGLMKRQIDTLGGRWSNLIDTLNIKAAEFLDKSGLKEWLKTAMVNLSTWIGTVFDSLTKAVQKVRPIIERVFNFVRDNKDAFIAGAAAIGVMTLAMGALAVATNLTGIPALIFAIGALVAGIVMAYKRVEWFRNAVDAAWSWIQKATAWFVDWFKKYAWPIIHGYLKFWVAYMRHVVWPVLKVVFKAIGKVLQWLWAYISKVWWPTIRFVFRKLIEIWRAAWPAVKTAWDSIMAKFKAAKAVIMTVVDVIKNGFKTLWNGLSEGLPAAIQTVKDWLSKIPGFGALIDGFLFTGGPVAAGGTYMVGELGPELFIPNVGSPSMVGAGGPEVRSFNTSGVIIPNHLVAPTVAIGASGPSTTQQINNAPGVHIEHLTVQDKFDARREFDAMMARQRRIAAERS